MATERVPVRDRSKVQKQRRGDHRLDVVQCANLEESRVVLGADLLSMVLGTMPAGSL